MWGQKRNPALPLPASGSFKLPGIAHRSAVARQVGEDFGFEQVQALPGQGGGKAAEQGGYIEHGVGA